MAIPGQTGVIELSIKFISMPTVATVENDWKRFSLLCGDHLTVTVTMRPKIFRKLEEGVKQWPDTWIARMTGEIGPHDAEGFILLNADVKVFERKPQPAKVAVEAISTPASSAPSK